MISNYFTVFVRGFLKTPPVQAVIFVIALVLFYLAACELYVWAAKKLGLDHEWDN